MSRKCVIIDDEPLARERIRTLLKEESDFEVVAECASGPEAVATLSRVSPELIFLDIQMPGMNGFEVLKELGKEKVPVVIFVTAYDQHALKAFEVHALDYLLKPFKPSRFKEAVERARQVLAQRGSRSVPDGLAKLLAELAPRREFLNRLAVRTSDKLVFVKVEQIDYLESAGNYVVLHSGKENHVIRETLSYLEDKLDPKRFIRINRSTMVNVDQIKALQPLFKGDHAVMLHNGKQLTMTRGVREIQDLLKFA